MTSRHPAVSCACPKCQSERRTPPTPATDAPAFNDYGCIYCRAQGSDCEGPHKFATEAEAVAFAAERAALAGAA